MFNGLQLIWLAIVALVLGHSTAKKCEPPTLANGYMTTTPNYGKAIHVEFHCNQQYILLGDKTSFCSKTDSQGFKFHEVPVCAKIGCTTMPIVQNGEVSFANDYTTAVLKCDHGFGLVGNQKAYCNGTDWNQPLGTCADKLSCDFETDMCGWANSNYFHDKNIGWSRVSRFDFTYDHTTKTSTGHFLLRPALSWGPSLESPLYSAEMSTDACLQIWYYPPDTKLTVYAKTGRYHAPKYFERLNEDYAPNQIVPNDWQMALFRVPTLNEDFKVRIYAKDPTRYVTGGFAIDDIKLMSASECSQ